MQSRSRLQVERRVYTNRILLGRHVLAVWSAMIDVKKVASEFFT